jgi:hypothetical protein
MGFHEFGFCMHPSDPGGRGQPVLPIFFHKVATPRMIPLESRQESEAFEPPSREGRQGNAKSFQNRDQDSLKRATTHAAYPGVF